MGGYKILNQDGLHFLTFTVVEWVDVFTRKMYKDILIESLKHSINNKGLILNAYVIMSNHLHIIAHTDNDAGLSAIIRDFKKFTSKEIIKTIMNEKTESRKKWMIKIFKENGINNSNNKKYQFWIQKNRPTELVSPKWINQKLNYIHNNPVKAGIVENADDYIYSSARNYIGKEGIIDVEVIDLPDNIKYI